MDTGIYKIQNQVNDKVYIGSGIIEDRFYNHRYKLNKNIHKNDHLQNSWNKYGEENFEFQVLIYCSKEHLGFYEEKFIVDAYESYKSENGYNLKKGRDSAEHTKESKLKMSKSKLGEKNPMFGKSRKQETKEKIAKSNNGKKLSNEAKQKISEIHRDKNVSEKTRHKMSQAKSGDSHPLYNKRRKDETKNKISNAMQGEDNPMSKITNNQALNVKKLLKNTNKTHKEISNICNVEKSIVKNISAGNSWNHLKVSGVS